jgi:NADH-quinone oxidoreductase E subunit
MANLFSEASEKKIEDILKRYPNKQAALLPVLWVAQEQFEWISPETMDLVAKKLGLSPAHVYGVATFYTMFNKKPIGKYHIQVCGTLPCDLLGCGGIIKYIKEKLNVKSGETTLDKKFTFSTVECLASCGSGPMMTINEKYHEDLTPEKVDKILEGLK